MAGVSAILDAAGGRIDGQDPARQCGSLRPWSPRVPTTESPDPSRAASCAQETADRVHQATTIVAPVLAEALEFDGRGSFGCMAVSPPVILSEAEALDLIRNELRTAGLDLEPGARLDRVMAPAIGRPRAVAPRAVRPTGLRLGPPEESHSAVARPAVLTSSPSDSRTARLAGEIMVGGRMAVPELVSRDYVFDFADKGRSVFIDYLGPNDHDAWLGREGGSGYSRDLTALVRKVSNAFGKRESDRDTVFGLFFDPLAKEDLPYPDITGLDHAQQRMVREEYRRAQKEDRQNLQVKAREKLRQQVRYFIEFLRQQGLIQGSPSGVQGTTGQVKGQVTHASDTTPDQPM